MGRLRGWKPVAWILVLPGVHVCFEGSGVASAGTVFKIWVGEVQWWLGIYKRFLREPAPMPEHHSGTLG